MIPVVKEKCPLKELIQSTKEFNHGSIIFFCERTMGLSLWILHNGIDLAKEEIQPYMLTFAP